MKKKKIVTCVTYLLRDILFNIHKRQVKKIGKLRITFFPDGFLLIATSRFCYLCNSQCSWIKWLFYVQKYQRFSIYSFSNLENEFCNCVWSVIYTRVPLNMYNSANDHLFSISTCGLKLESYSLKVRFLSWYPSTIKNTQILKIFLPCSSFSKVFLHIFSELTH